MLHIFFFGNTFIVKILFYKILNPLSANVVHADLMLL